MRSRPTHPAPPRDAKQALLDRDHSILAFNERVFNWAQRPEVPLLERLRYLHDERDAWTLGPDGGYQPPAHPGGGKGAQTALMRRYGDAAGGARKKRKAA